MQALALVEHVDRELDVVCLLKLLLKQRHGIDLGIANFYADAPLLLAGRPPRVALTPFFYSADDAVASDYASGWPGVRFANLAWEQVLYPSHQAIKRPRDAFSQRDVVHFAWTQTFADYLQGHAAEHVRIVGHALYRLYQEPYRGYFPSRDQLARRHGLDPSKRWVFVPENYRWAFFKDAKLRRLAGHGAEEADLFEMRDYCARSLPKLVKWCSGLAADPGVEVIFRPRPATREADMDQLINTVLKSAPRRFHLIKEGSAREWVLASDKVVSSYSTVLIEGALAGKAILRVAPEPTPAGLKYDWCDLVPAASTRDEFIAVCLENDRGVSGQPLKDWAERTFFPAGDPVDRLVETLAQVVRASRDRGLTPRKGPHGMAMPAWVRMIARLAGPRARHRLLLKHCPGYAYNLATHEKDLFSQADVRARVERWESLLGGAAAWSASAASLPLKPAPGAFGTPGT